MRSNTLNRRVYIASYAILSLLLNLCLPSLTQASSPAPIHPPSIKNALPVLPTRITLIMDDMGNNLATGRRALALPGDITFAVLPHAPGSVIFAKEAYAKGLDVMLHAPMESEEFKKLGPGGLTLAMNQTEFIRTLRGNINAVPHIVGVNNHMGSLLTQHSQPMRWLMEELNRQNLFFVDSRTSSQSIARSTARSATIPSLTRDVFLDHNRSPQAIKRSFNQLVRLAQFRGYAVGICHPYPNTLEFLEETLPRLRQRNIILLSASKMLERSGQLEGLRHAKESSETERLSALELVSDLPIPDGMAEWAF